MRFLTLLLSIFMASMLAPSARAQGAGLIVSGVQVDVGGKSAADARRNGWREAQRLAWPRLWTKITGQPANGAPRLGDSALDGIVAGIEVEREQAGPTRYIAQLSVVFDRVRASRYLGSAGGLTRSPPLLLIPVLQDGGARYAYEGESPWLAAWGRLRQGESPVDYVRIAATQGDVILLSAWNTQRRDIEFWRDTVARYGVADVLMPELILERSYPGGPVRATLMARAGTEGQEVGRASFENRGGDVADLLDTAVREADRIYTAALREGRLKANPDLLIEAEVPVSAAPTLASVGTASFGIELRVSTPDNAAADAALALLRGLGATGVRLVALNLGAESLLTAVPPESFEELRYRLDQRGFTLQEDAAGLLLRPRRPDDPRVERPVVPAEEGEEAVGPSGASAPNTPAAPPAGSPATSTPQPSVAPGPPTAPAAPAPRPAAPTPPPQGAPKGLLPPGNNG